MRYFFKLTICFLDEHKENWNSFIFLLSYKVDLFFKQITKSISHIQDLWYDIQYCNGLINFQNVKQEEMHKVAYVFRLKIRIKNSFLNLSALMSNRTFNGKNFLCNE